MGREVGRGIREGSRGHWGRGAPDSLRSCGPCKDLAFVLSEMGAMEDLGQRRDGICLTSDLHFHPRCVIYYYNTIISYHGCAC